LAKVPRQNRAAPCIQGDRRKRSRKAVWRRAFQPSGYRRLKGLPAAMKTASRTRQAHSSLSKEAARCPIRAACAPAK
jgi:hypothetical protein